MAFYDTRHTGIIRDCRSCEKMKSVSTIIPFRSPAITWLTVLVTALSLAASIGGLCMEGLYRDSELIKTAWFANDIVTLFVAPLLLITLALQKKGDQRALLVWLGLMLYMLYNYAFYLFGAKFNEFFLIYTALFSLSIYSLMIGLLSLDLNAIPQNSPFRRNKIWISAFLMFLALPLLIVEAKACLTFIVSGIQPQIPTLIFALDLSIVAPTTMLASILLWRRHPWGDVLAMMVLVKAFCYGAVLVTGTLLITASHLAPLDELLPFYLSLVVGGLVFGIMLLRDLKPKFQIVTETI